MGETNWEEILRGLLRKIAAERNYSNSQITTKEISSGGANYTSKLFAAVISESNKDDLELFAKVAILSKNIRELMSVKIYNSENMFYMTLLQKYKKIEDLYCLTEDQRLGVPEFYGCDPTEMQETLVLENLVAKGYSSYDRFCSMDWEYASAAITELAKLHALSFAYAALNPEEYQEYVANLNVVIKTSMMDSYVTGPINQALETVEPQHKEKLRKFVETFTRKRHVELYFPVLKTAICHLDFRASNLLSKRREDGRVDIKIVDFQTMQASCPVTDLLYFIFTGSDEEFRGQYYEQLIEHYYSQLNAAMLRLQLDPDQHYSRAVFNYELKVKQPFGLNIAIISLPVVTVEEADAPNLEEEVVSITKTSELYASRLQGVVRDYVKWGVLK